jgi:ATP-binding cassette subfamily B protein/subfamily B ATP-binding cassette protein MsbA
MSTWWIKVLRHAHVPVRTALAVTLLVIGVNVVAVLTPWPMKLLVDGVLRPVRDAQQSYGWLAALPGASGSKTILIAWLAGAGVVLFCLVQIVRVCKTYVMTGLGARLAYSLGARLLERLQELSLIFHTRQRVGDLVRRVIADSGCVRDLVCNVIVPGAEAAGSLVFMFVMMCLIDPVLSVITVAFAVPLAIVIRVFARPMGDRCLRQQQLEGELLSHAEQTLGALPVVQSFTREAEQDRQFRELASRTLSACLRALAAQLQFKIGAGSITAIGTATIMIIAGLHVINGRMSAGDLLIFVTYVAMLYAPLETLAYLSTSLAAASAGARRALEILESTERVVEEPHARPLHVPAGTRGVPIRFDHVTFGYRRPHAVLHSIDLQIDAGQVAALVGPSGAGKSTLVSLVPRLLDPWGGRVCIADRDLREFTLESLRHQIAVVPQEPLLLPLSIAANIAYGRPGASLDEIRRAADAANASEFIERLPGGYDTVIGERGATLSVGQRQRLAIARALLKDAPVLILDEPTSALDAATEHALVEALHRLMSGRTCLIIAHRLSTIRHAHRVIVLDAGRIVQDGSHAELLAQPGLFQHLHSLQRGQVAEVQS